MLAKTLVVFYVWSPDIFVLIFIITLFQALFILLCQIKHYHTIPYKSKIHSSDDYYCSGKTLCYFIVHNVILLLIEVDVVRRSLS